MLWILLALGGLIVHLRQKEVYPIEESEGAKYWNKY